MINIMDHVGYVKYMANKFRRTGQYEDMVQEGMLALHLATETFDPEYGVNFLTYARYKVYDRISEYCKRLDNYSSRAEDIDNPEQAGQCTKNMFIVNSRLSVNDCILLEEIKERINKLSPKSRDILLELYYTGDTANHAEAARRRGVSRQSVHQLAAAGLKQVKEGLKDGR